MKKVLILVGCFAVAAIASLSNRGGLLRNPLNSAASIEAGEDVFASAFAEHRSDFEVEGRGTVTRILSDDTDGSRHQRFIISLGSGQTLLIAHNIDLAPRVDPLAVGD